MSAGETSLRRSFTYVFLCIGFLKIIILHSFFFFFLDYVLESRDNTSYEFHDIDFFCRSGDLRKFKGVVTGDMIFSFLNATLNIINSLILS